jgi:hypothetical protein
MRALFVQELIKLIKWIECPTYILIFFYSKSLEKCRGQLPMVKKGAFQPHLGVVCKAQEANGYVEIE